MKSGNLNFLESSGTLQACNGTALPSIGSEQYALILLELNSDSQSNNILGNTEKIYM
jgi:hypothetical protein